MDVPFDTVEGVAIDDNEGVLILNTVVELRVDEGEDEAVRNLKLTTELELMDEDNAVPELATEVELRRDEDEEVTTKVEFKLDAELDLKFRSAA